MQRSQTILGIITQILTYIEARLHTGGVTFHTGRQYKMAKKTKAELEQENRELRRELGILKLEKIKGENLQRAKDLLSEHGFMLEIDLLDHGETTIMAVHHHGELIHSTFAHSFNMKEEETV